MSAFRDRRDAGRKLAQALSHYASRSDVTIFGLPRGGVPVAYEVALALNAPLDIFIVRKLGLPGREELAIGAIGSGGVRVLNEDVVRMLNVPQEVVNIIIQRELQELQHREHIYRGNQTAPETRDRTVILIDDGLATGASMRAAVIGLRARHPARIVIAVPVAAPEVCHAFQFAVVYGILMGINGAHFPATSTGWLGVAGIVLIATVIPVATFLAGLERIGPTNASLLSTLEPVVTVLLAWMIFGERLQPITFLGGALILVAVILLTGSDMKAGSE